MAPRSPPAAESAGGAPAAYRSRPHEPFLVHRGLRYLWVAAAVVAASVVAYAIHRPRLGVANGGTWLGYTLGVIAAALVLWLAYYRIRKRRYGVGRQPLTAWLSAHVYLGIAVVVVATLHAGFELGPNVHGLTWVLLVVVVLSGIVGALAYARYPRQMTRNRAGVALDDLLNQIATLDAECRAASLDLDDALARAVHAAGTDTRIGGGWWRRVVGRDDRCPTRHALDLARSRARDAVGSDARPLRRLITLLARKDALVGIARREARMRTLLGLWLYVHVPATVGLLTALALHVVSVFWYW
ncbi:MAG: hypothetical protein H6983_01110 [Ectothiorhodospiraceae bacterium]|nr:hypothetical protein [Ectothiorhodospiraceae bacterium]